MFYPIMVDISHRKIVVIGGGKIGYRKARNLLEFGGEIIVLSPEFIDEFHLLKEKYKDKIKFIKDSYKKEYIKDAFLVIASTSSKQINEQIAIDSSEYDILCNVVDNREKSSFISTSTINKEGLVVSISTMGKFPYLSKKVRKDMENNYSKFDKEYTENLEALRKVVLIEYKDKSREIFEYALGLNINELKVFIKELTKGKNSEE